MKLCDEVLGLLEQGDGTATGNPMIKGKTTKTNNHWHKYNLDNEGSGQTDQEDGHFHKVMKFKIAPEGGHTHETQVLGDKTPKT